MAKALYGHMNVGDVGSDRSSGSEVRLAAEVRRLRIRVADLEAKVDRLLNPADVDCDLLASDLEVELRKSARV